MSVLFGLYQPEAGEIKKDGKAVEINDPNDATALGIGMVHQHFKLVDVFTVLDNIILGAETTGKLGFLKKKEAREKADPLFAEFGLEGTQYKYPHQLSGGMRQRAALLRTYLSSSGVALLDEPFSALDTLTKSSIHKWYLEIMQHIDLSTLFITHDIDEAILLSDRIYILNGKPGQIRDEIIIKEKKPRGEEFPLSEEFLAYKRAIISKL